MLGGHVPELLIVLVLALVFFGPQRLPEIGSSLGKGIRDFRKSVGLLEDAPAPRPVPTAIEPHGIVDPMPEHRPG